MSNGETLWPEPTYLIAFRSPLWIRPLLGGWLVNYINGVIKSTDSPQRSGQKCVVVLISTGHSKEEIGGGVLRTEYYSRFRLDLCGWFQKFDPRRERCLPVRRSFRLQKCPSVKSKSVNRQLPRNNINTWKFLFIIARLQPNILDLPRRGASICIPALDRWHQSLLHSDWLLGSRHGISPYKKEDRLCLFPVVDMCDPVFQISPPRVRARSVQEELLSATFPVSRNRNWILYLWKSRVESRSDNRW